MRLRRWRVARVHRQRKGGYDSPPVRFWTKAGARAAAIQLNMLHEVFGSRQSMLSALQGAGGEHRWMPIRHRTLRGVQAHNIVVESGSYDRHPAGSGPLSSRIKGRVVPSADDFGPNCTVVGTGTCEKVDDATTDDWPETQPESADGDAVDAGGRAPLAADAPVGSDPGLPRGGVTGRDHAA